MIDEIVHGFLFGLGFAWAGLLSMVSLLFIDDLFERLKTWLRRLG